MASLPGAPTIPRPAAPGQSQPANPNAAKAVVPKIPFTRAARKKSRLIGTYGPIALGAAAVQQAPIQIPANGYLRKLIFDVTGTTAGNAANVTFANDAPMNVVQQFQFAAANGDTIYSTMDFLDLFFINKYFACGNGGYDACAEPSFSKVTGSGATGGSFHFQVELPLEWDTRDAAGALTNMAANQSFLFQYWLNNSASLYGTAPTNPPSITITVTAEYWAAPATQNPQGIEQETAPRCNGLVPLFQTQTPPVVANADQTIQLTNVGNTIRVIMFRLMTGAGARTETDWPNQLQFSVNGDTWNFKLKNNWLKEMAERYKWTADGAQVTKSAAPAAGLLDNGIYVYTDFIDDGSAGNNRVDGASNRDLMLVTGSATALNIEAQNWGATAGQLKVITMSLRIPDVAAFYAPFGI